MLSISCTVIVYNKKKYWISPRAQTASCSYVMSALPCVSALARVGGKAVSALAAKFGEGGLEEWILVFVRSQRAT